MYGTVWYTGIVCRYYVSSKLYGAVMGEIFLFCLGLYYRIYNLAHLKGLAARRNLTKTEFSQVAVSTVIIQYV